MGAGILPIAIHKGQLYFLFGKENKYADTPGYADFGGGALNPSESLLETAIREFTEETTGYWGSIPEMTEYINAIGSKYIDIPAAKGSRKTISYRTYLLPVKYSPSFETFYNNNHAFLEERLPVDVYKNSKIFEKSQVRWMTINDLYAALVKKRKKAGKEVVGKEDIVFRPYYMYIIQQLVDNYDKLHEFVMDRTQDGRSYRLTANL